MSKSQVKWNALFENTQLKWSDIYNIPVQCCGNTKMHWFQYRILRRIIATNDLLYKTNTKQINVTPFCTAKIEKNRTYVLAI